MTDAVRVLGELVDALPGMVIDTLREQLRRIKALTQDIATIGRRLAALEARRRGDQAAHGDSQRRPAGSNGSGGYDGRPTCVRLRTGVCRLPGPGTARDRYGRPRQAAGYQQLSMTPVRQGWPPRGIKRGLACCQSRIEWGRSHRSTVCSDTEASVESDSTLYVGLDVHKDSITVAYAIGMSEVELFGKVGTMLIDIDRLCKKLQTKARHICFVYEAGPCGYGLYRRLVDKASTAWSAHRHSFHGNRETTSRQTVATRSS